MKRIVLSLIISIIGLTAYSQEHMKFKGIEMNTTTPKFAKKLIKEGYVQDYRKDDTFILKGDFAGYNAKIYLYPNNSKQIMYAVASVECYTWGHLKSVFNTFLQLLTQKYGNPLLSSHTFKESYSEGDGNELTALRNGYVEWDDRWLFLEGKIFLQMSADVVGTPMVTLTYLDEINSNDDRNRSDDL